MPEHTPIVYLQGAFMPIDQAHVPVLDRGFIFGDGVYEVIPVYSRRPFRLQEHLRRLQHSLDGIRLSNPHTDQEWADLVAQLIARNDGEDQSVYMQITRGVARRDHAFPPGIKPTIFIMSNPMTLPQPELRASGVSAITAPDNRWLRCDIKATSLLPNVLLRQLAVDAGAAEVVLLRDGCSSASLHPQYLGVLSGSFLTEGAASNIFVVQNNTLLAPPKDHLMLPGITYDVVIELAVANNIRCEVRPISEHEVRTAQELWQTSSLREVMPITLLDGKPVGDGRPGPLFRKMYALYQDYKQAVRAGKE